jgi:hypothetical protein
MKQTEDKEDKANTKGMSDGTLNNTLKYLH